MILHKFSFGPLHTTAILFACSETKRAAVIDPGVDSTDTLLKAIEDESLILEKILLTHSHWDHIAGVHILHEKTKAPVFIHPLDRKNLEHPGSDGIPLFSPLQGETSGQLLKDGEVLMVGHLEIHVLHTPGHSPGGVCFYLPHEHLLFSGDTLFQGTIGNLSLPTASAIDMWPSLQKLAELPPDTRVIPGHGKETTIRREHWLNRAEEVFGE